MLAVVNGPLVAAGAPPLLPHFLENTRSNQFGKLDFTVWELKINRELLVVRDPTPEQFAAACDTMAHEARHALQWFRMARLDPAGVRASIDPQAMKAAEQANQGTRRAERFAPGQQKYQDAQAYHDSVYGAGEADRARIYDDKKNRLLERDVAYDELQRVVGLPINDPVRRAAEEQYRQAEEKYETAHEAYENLAEEIDARRHGQTTAQAVGQLMRSMDSARVRQQAAYRDYRAAEAAALVTRHRVPIEQRKAAREEAFRRYEAADALVRRIENQLRTRSTGGPKP
jgi:hypothetical protein